MRPCVRACFPAHVHNPHAPLLDVLGTQRPSSSQQPEPASMRVGRTVQGSCCAVLGSSTHPLHVPRHAPSCPPAQSLPRAGMNRADRTLVEDLFADGHVQVSSPECTPLSTEAQRAEAACRRMVRVAGSQCFLSVP